MGAIQDRWQEMRDHRCGERCRIPLRSREEVLLACRMAAWSLAGLLVLGAAYGAVYFVGLFAKIAGAL